MSRFRIRRKPLSQRPIRLCAVRFMMPDASGRKQQKPRQGEHQDNIVPLKRTMSRKSHQLHHVTMLNILLRGGVHGQ